jgi:hypothetical protein
MSEARQRVFHGDLQLDDFVEALIADFNHSNLRAQQIGSGPDLVIQIATPQMRASGGSTALAVQISSVEDGVLVRLGQQQWFGVAASLGKTALMALRNPWSLLGRIDDLAQDVQSLQLENQVWLSIERTAASLGASYQISERLRRLVCLYCQTPNAVGVPHCISCGAPLGESQPVSCMQCGHIQSAEKDVCENCGQALQKNNPNQAGGLE